MRAKVSAVVLVAFGLLGAVVITASAADRAQVAGDDIVLTTAGDTVSGGMITPADRGHDNDHDHDGGGDPECIAEEEVVVGPVCVEVEDVISDILST